MQICQKLAGYTFAHADLVRRAMAKKKHKEMEEERSKFTFGCEKNGIAKEIADSIFDDMSSFASYAFNKSHAAAYATVAYQTAYLKCHYPAEFMAAQITSVLDNTDKVVSYVAECQSKGIRVLPPHINHSESGFTAADGNITFGLMAIKGLGRNLIEELLKERELGGPYTGLYNFLKRLQGRFLNRKAVENLIKSGAMDSLGLNRRQMITALPEMMSELEQVRRKNVEGQLGLFDLEGLKETREEGVTVPDLPEFRPGDLLAFEKETTGLYISGHPMQEYEAVSKALKGAKISELLEAEENGTSKYSDNDSVKVLGMVSGIKLRITRNNTTMANATLEDVTGSIDLVIFPKTYLECGKLLQEGAVLLVHGRLSVQEEERPQLLAMRLDPCPKEEEAGNLESSDKSPGKQHKVNGLFLRLNSAKDDRLPDINNLLEIFSGGSHPVYFYFKETQQYTVQRQFGTVMVSDGLLSELRRILGEENVVYR